MIIFVYSFLKRIINKFKKLSYILLSLNFAILQINFNFLGLMFFLGANKELMNQLYSEKAIFYILLIILISLISSLIYLWYYFPKNQGKQWSINQMWKGEIKSKNAQYKTNFLIIFGLSMIVPSLLVESIENIFGFLLGILFSLVIPSLTIDSLYAAYYVHKYPDYE